MATKLQVYGDFCRRGPLPVSGDQTLPKGSSETHYARQRSITCVCMSLPWRRSGEVLVFDCSPYYSPIKEKKKKKKAATMTDRGSGKVRFFKPAL